jgi:hypothetical protein
LIFFTGKHQQQFKKEKEKGGEARGNEDEEKRPVYISLLTCFVGRIYSPEFMLEASGLDKQLDENCIYGIRERSLTPIMSG